jgi:hypothetical protein
MAAELICVSDREKRSRSFLIRAHLRLHVARPAGIGHNGDASGGPLKSLKRALRRRRGFGEWAVGKAPRLILSDVL